eukprot:665847-Rhodomonas_salina.1
MIGKAWQGEQVVMGLRVCKQLHRDLLMHADNGILLAGSAGAKTIADDLAQDFRRVSHMKIFLRWNGLLDALIDAAPMMASLVHLDLSRNGMLGKRVGLLSGVLGKCTKLAYLDLSNNGICVEGAGMLARMLAQGECKNLARLHLSHNKIGDRGAGELAGVLGGCTALAYLDLSHNEIRAEGVGRLAGVLGGCKDLARLDLSHNAIA